VQTNTSIPLNHDDKKRSLKTTKRKALYAIWDCLNGERGDILMLLRYSFTTT
jgi:hypothetical protein